MRSLVIFRSANNNLTVLPDGITELAKLELLDVGINMLETLPKDIGKLESLRFLYIGRNRIDRIPESIGNCQKLQELDAAYCGVLRLTNALSDIRKLENVYIDSRTVMFYQNPRNAWRQRVKVVDGDSNIYRTSQ